MAFLSLIQLSILLLARSRVSQGQGPTTQPILRIEANSHAGYVSGVATDRASKFLVTASDDKSARVWELPSLRLLKVLRPPIGTSANEGKLYTVAISPDGSTVALGGWTGFEWDKIVSVYMFDRESGQMIGRIQQLASVVQALAFDSAGKRLAIGLASGGFRVAQVSDGATLFEDSKVTEGVTGVAFEPTGKLAVSSSDKILRLYDLAYTAVHQAALSSLGLPAGLAFSPDGAHIAVATEGKPSVTLYSGTDLSKEISPRTTGLNESVGAVCWSNDGTTLVAAGAATRQGRFIMRSWNNHGMGDPVDVPVGSNTIYSLAPIAEKDFAFGAADSFGVAANAAIEVAVADPRSVGAGFQVTRDGDGVWFAYANGGNEPASFSIAARAINVASTSDAVHSAGTPPIHSAEGISVTNWFASDEPKLNGVKLPLREGEKSQCFSIVPDGSGMLLGTDWRVCSYDAKGTLKWGTDTASTCWGINLTGDGKLVIATLGDGTIRWYNASTGAELLALYPHTDKKRWVLFTASGYYDCSPGGEDLIGWSVNNGPDHAADFYPASRFRPSKYRPDVIDKILGTMDEAEALRLADAARTQAPKERAVQEILPPVVRILSKNNQGFDGKSAKIEYSVKTPTGEPITKIAFLIDGISVKVEDHLNLVAKVEAKKDVTLDLPNKDANVSVIAFNRFGAGEAETVSFRYKSGSVTPPVPPAPVIQPTLYVLSIGVGSYKDARVASLKFPVKDANDFANKIKAQGGGLYKDIQIRTLPNPNLETIMDGLEWIQKSMNSHDVAMIYLSGHGENDNSNNYYFLPATFNQDRVLATGLSFAAIRNTIESLPGKRLLFVDTCRSGNAFGNGTVRGGAGDITGLIHELSSAENGVVVFTACTGRESAIEKDEWGNGAFTKALLEGLDGKASTSPDGKVTVTMLDAYITKQVAALTGGRQHATCIKPQTIPDFPIAIAKVK